MRIVNRQLKQVPQYTRSDRHSWARWEHGTPKKWANFLQAKMERRLHLLKVRSLPHFMVIDPCNYCDLRCPLCPTGIGELGQKQAFLSFQHFKEYFDVLAEYLFEVYLYNWGESLLNKQVYRMIEYAQSRNVGTNMSSNFVNVSSRDIDLILRSGLEYLTISLDGASPETYEKYRVRGHFESVYENMVELLGKRKGKLPRVEWQMIVMKHNEHELEEVERLAAKVGVDVLRFIPVALQVQGKDRTQLAQEWFPVNFKGRKIGEKEIEQQFGQADKPSPCFYLYDTMTVTPTGGVLPCCVAYKPEEEFGRFPIRNIRQFWNNDRYQSARAQFSQKNAEQTVKVTCDGCDIFRKPIKTPVKDFVGGYQPLATGETEGENPPCGY